MRFLIQKHEGNLKIIERAHMALHPFSKPSLDLRHMASNNSLDSHHMKTLFKVLEC